MTLSRRAFLIGGLTVSAVGVLRACAVPGMGSPTATSAPTTAPRPLSTRAPVLPPTATPIPTTEPAPPGTPDPGVPVPGSFGPNGLHYPTATPQLGSTAATELVVEASWAAIDAALRSLTPAAVNAGAVIRVKPGSLVGFGSGSSAQPVLEGIGSSAWTKNVLICPRDGYGSVTMTTDGFRLNRCQRLSLFGFTGPTVGFVLTNCAFLEVGWGIWSTVNVTQSGSNIAFYELVAGFRRDPNDTVGIRPTDSNRMGSISRYGCVFGPSVKPAGSSAHCDTIQLERTGFGAFGPFTSIDCIDFGSSNAAILGHSALSVLEFRHCLILADLLPWQIYPLKAGDYQGKPNAFSGGAPDVRLYDSYVCGALGGLGYTHVVNTTVNYQPQDSQNPLVEGSWTVDPSMTSWNKAQIVALAGTDFSAASLSRFWRW